LANYKLDLTGYECPAPLIHVKSALQHMKQGDKVSIIITQESCFTDILDFAKRKQYTVSQAEQKNGGYIITIEKK